jgi:hypothetical protein
MKQNKEKQKLVYSFQNKKKKAKQGNVNGAKSNLFNNISESCTLFFLR